MDHLDEALARDFAKLGWRAADATRRPAATNQLEPTRTAGAANSNIVVNRDQPVGPTAVEVTDLLRHLVQRLDWLHAATDGSSADRAPFEGTDAGTARTTRGRLSELADRIEHVDARVAEIGAAVEGVETTLGVLDAHLRGVRAALASGDANLASMGVSFEARLDAMARTVPRPTAPTDLRSLGARLGPIEEDIDRLVTVLLGRDRPARRSPASPPPLGGTSGDGRFGPVASPGHPVERHDGDSGRSLPLFQQPFGAPHGVVMIGREERAAPGTQGDDLTSADRDDGLLPCVDEAAVDDRSDGHDQPVDAPAEVRVRTFSLRRRKP